MKTFFHRFRKPYPPPESGTSGIILAIVLGFFIGAFLTFFQPFNIPEMQLENKSIKIFFYGVITFLVMISFFHFLPMGFPKLMSEKNWQVRHQIAYLILMTFCIATLNGLYVNYLNDLSFSWMNYYRIIRDTAIIGIIPVSFIVLIDQNRKWKKYAQAAANLKISEPQNTASPPKENIIIPYGTNDDKILIHLENLLFVESDGNYIEVSQLTENKISKNLYRISLRHLESHLPSNQIIRCHRSFLVNLKKVNNVNGNAQGFKLSLENCPTVIPVSRKYVPLVKKYFSK